MGQIKFKCKYIVKVHGIVWKVGVFLGIHNSWYVTDTFYFTSCWTRIGHLYILLSSNVLVQCIVHNLYVVNILVPLYILGIRYLDIL